VDMNQRQDPAGFWQTYSRPGRDRAMRVLSSPAGGGSHPGRHQAQRPPGSEGERLLQERYGTADRARRFYEGQFSDRLTERMIEFIGRMEMAFIATSDAEGDCDCSFRAGEAGFLRVLDERTVAYPELRGNGVMASMGNILENPHIGIFLVDFTRDLIGLHINGEAQVITPAEMQELDRDLPEPSAPAGKKPVHWVLIRVTEAYIHCSKHIPKLVPQSRVRHWGTDSPRHKGGDYFGAIAAKQEPAAALASAPVPEDALIQTPSPAPPVTVPAPAVSPEQDGSPLPAVIVFSS
jgi:uncharacterized protein